MSSAAAAAHAPTDDAVFTAAATLNLYFTIAPILFTMTSDSSPKRLSDADYTAKAAAVLAAVEACLDRWLEDDVVDIDAQRSGGLLEMKFPNRSVIVLNTQAPLQELWMAARSGGYHYRFSEGAWRDTRDGRELLEALSTCASEQAGKALTFTLPAE